MASDDSVEILTLTKPHFPFLALSAELRNAVYEYAIDWPDLSIAFERIATDPGLAYDQDASKSLPLCTFPKPHFEEKTTPSLLLVNRQITAEALEILYVKPLILTSTPPYIPQLAKPMDICDEFISEATLQRLRFVVLKIDLKYKPEHLAGSARCWLKTVETLLDVWCVRNVLERVEVEASYVPASKATGWTFAEAGHHRQVMSLLSRV